MVKVIKNNIDIVLEIIILILLSVFYIKQGLILLIMVLNFICALVFNGLFKYQMFKKYTNSIELVSKRTFFVLRFKDVLFKNVNMRKQDYLIIVSIFPFMIFNMNIFIISLLNSFKLFDSVQARLIEVTLVVLVFWLVLVFKDLRVVIEGIIRFTKSYVKFSKNGEHSFQKETRCKTHHVNVFFIEEDYKLYKLKDLKREKLYLEGKLFKISRPRFFDTYIFPMIILITGSISTLLNLIYSFYFSNVNVIITENDLVEMVKAHLLILGTIIFLICTFLMMYRKPSYENLADLKIRAEVVKELIEYREKNQCDQGKELLLKEET